FSWLIVDDSENSVFAWLRTAPGQNPIAVICNFTPVHLRWRNRTLPRLRAAGGQPRDADPGRTPGCWRSPLRCWWS
ncbi:MAG: alpha amylase C-terminal domain-containing protein, partial [Rhodanobacter lindaniclasticus]